MAAYAIRRLLLIIPTFLLITILVFLSTRFIPGDVIDMMLAQMNTSGTAAEMTRTNLEKALGLDAPIHIQYFRWLGVAPQENGQFRGILEGDLGNSLWKNESVSKLIFERLPISLELGIIAIILSLFVAFPIGIYSAIRQDTWGDYVGRSLAILFISVPSFWVATLLFVYPPIYWGWSPPTQYIRITENFWGNLGQFVIPAFITGMMMGGTLMRMLRTMMLETLRQDYIRTAWAKGLKENAVILQHALKNALLPVVTIVGGMIPMIIVGGVVMEQIFALPGVGILTFQALGQRDYPLLQGITMLLVLIVLFSNVVVDLVYAWIDPRVQYR
ncbi:MAG: ABC transporter permease [Dehalococcoidales bacterium]|nr:ABC transporter permease [Dehalococcoidales bacterium]